MSYAWMQNGAIFTDALLAVRTFRRPRGQRARALCLLGVPRAARAPTCGKGEGNVLNGRFSTP